VPQVNDEKADGRYKSLMNLFQMSLHLVAAAAAAKTKWAPLPLDHKQRLYTPSYVSIRLAMYRFVRFLALLVRCSEEPARIFQRPVTSVYALSYY